jgi:hypothetical protein
MGAGAAAPVARLADSALVPLVTTSDWLGLVIVGSVVLCIFNPLKFKSIKLMIISNISLYHYIYIEKRKKVTQHYFSSQTYSRGTHLLKLKRL